MIKPYFSFFLGLLLLVFIFYRGVLSDSKDYDVPIENLPNNENLNLKFKDVSQHSGRTTEFRRIWPKQTSEYLSKVRSIEPSIAISDIDQDGFLDIIIATAKVSCHGVEIYKNLGDLKFLDITKKWLYQLPCSNDISTLIGVADFNNDGSDDLLIGRMGIHSLYFWSQDKKRYVDNTEKLNYYYSNPWSLNILDYNQDGFLDIVFGNYYASVDLSSTEPPWAIFLGKSDLTTGGKNHILENKNGLFKKVRAVISKHNAHTASIGISDINHDGYPDIFEGNDQAKDFLFLNDRNRKFIDVTSVMMPIKEHTYGGMNSEFYDYDFDGEQNYMFQISRITH